MRSRDGTMTPTSSGLGRCGAARGSPPRQARALPASPPPRGICTHPRAAPGSASHPRRAHARDERAPATRTSPVPGSSSIARPARLARSFAVRSSAANAGRAGWYGNETTTSALARQTLEQRPLGARQVLEAVDEHRRLTPGLEISADDGSRRPRRRSNSRSMTPRRSSSDPVGAIQTPELTLDLLRLDERDLELGNRLSEGIGEAAANRADTPSSWRAVTRPRARTRSPAVTA